MRVRPSLLFAAAVLCAVTQPARLPAQAITNEVWQYTLLPDSRLVDDCPICGRPTILVPLRGTFSLRPVQANPLFSTYAWETIAWAADNGAGASYQVRGQGTFQVGGEVAVMQDLFLAVQIDTGWTNRLCYFTNGVRTLTRLWPMIQISVDQTNGLPIQQFHLDLSAAPFREIWFSTRAGFHAGVWQPPTNYVSPGDLLASAGRVVKTNPQLTARLGVMPVVPDLGLKDIDVLPGGEIAFSIEQDIFSEILGPLDHGDLLTDRGRVLATNAQLIAAFSPAPPVADVGLAAVQVLDSGEINFSVQTNFFSETLGRNIASGDWLSSRGGVVRNNADLLARFFPANPKQDYGLAAAYVWPSGEIWFATANGFTSTNGTAYLAGDLLSEQGYVVYHNLDLLAPFAPLEDLSNFGLDALFVVTDVTPPPPADHATAITPDPATGNLTLQFAGLGRVWQLERASTLPGPWTPVSPITTDLPLPDAGALTNLPHAFYRLREW